MKIISPSNKTIKPSEVAELEALGKAETAAEVLAAMPDVPVCAECSLKTSEVDALGLCSVCAKLGALESVPATDENLAKADAQLDKDASSVVVPPRPSLEVETDVYYNLNPRIDAHLARMRAWDYRKLSDDDRIRHVTAMYDMILAWKRIGESLIHLRASGFVAKTTPFTRIAAKLQHGAKVSLREDQRAIFAKVYSDEQLDSLSVVKVTDTHVQLMAEDGSNLGLVKLIHVSVKP
jgi:hypothetical protein